MKPGLVRLVYYDTYSFANLVHGLLLETEPETYYPLPLDEFFGGRLYIKFLPKFPKYSSIHLFFEYVFQVLICHDVDDIAVDTAVNLQDQHPLWVNDALEFHKIEHPSFRKWAKTKGHDIEDTDDDRLYAYLNALHEDGSLANLQRQIVEEVFFIMFLNREFLRQFHEIVSSHVGDVRTAELSLEDRECFKADGILKRCNIPTWAQRAVFYRDRGTCALCSRDISGLVRIGNSKHYDHIVALANGGINCVTNLQLLCDACNAKKAADSSKTSPHYESWY